MVDVLAAVGNPDLFQVTLPPTKYFQGHDLGYKIHGGLGNFLHIPWWKLAGKDGLHVKGYGADVFGGYTACSHIDSTAGYVLIEGVTFHAGSAECVYAGFDGYRNSDPLQGTIVHFRNCTFIDDGTSNSGWTKWGVMAYHADLIFEDCTWHYGASKEHGVYCHAFGGTVLLDGKRFGGVWIVTGKLRSA